jgi:hypothetical protein
MPFQSPTTNVRWHVCDGALPGVCPLCFHYSAIYALGVKHQKSLLGTFIFIIFFGGAAWNPMGNFFFGPGSQRLIPFVRENYCNCASCQKFCANEFFKLAHIQNFKIEAAQTHFLVPKWTLCVQFTRCQRTIISIWLICVRERNPGFVVRGMRGTADWDL